MKDWLREHQPVAMRMLENDLKTGQTSCAYLFAGPKGTHKKEAAILFAQSLVCPNRKDGWACGVCPVCERVRSGQYADIKILDGSDKMIRKEEIAALQEYCAKTALEEYGEKAYILHAADNMTTASMNSILKFLEEPEQKITAILTTDNPERLLSTIVSRCKSVPFYRPSGAELEKMAADAGLSSLDAHILTQNADEIAEIQSIAAKEGYQSGLRIWLEYIKELSKGIDAGQYYLEEEVLGNTDKSKVRETFVWFLNTGCVFVKDVLEGRNGISESWDKAQELFAQGPCTAKKMMIVLLECKDDLLKNANASLLIDRLGHRLHREV